MVCDLIAKILELLDENTGNYFPSLNTTLFDWIINPFIDTYENAQLTTVKENDLCDISNN